MGGSSRDSVCQIRLPPQKDRFTRNPIGSMPNLRFVCGSRIPADRPCRFAGIELHAVESGSRDVLLRSVDPDPVPILEGPVSQARVEQFRKLVLRSRDAFQRIAAGIGSAKGSGCRPSTGPPGRRRKSSSAWTAGRRSTWRSSAAPKRGTRKPSAPSGSPQRSASSCL